jgi:hypothetical protein
VRRALDGLSRRAEMARPKSTRTLSVKESGDFMGTPAFAAADGAALPHPA